MIPAVVLLLGIQQPQVSAAASPTVAAVGDTVVLTIRVESRGTEPVRIEDPRVPGLELHSARETSVVDFVADAPRRITTRVLRLVALRPGRWTIGPARAVQGAAVSATSPIGIEVTGDHTVVPLSGSMMRALIERAPPPAARGEVGVTLLTTPQAVVLGQQVDLFAIAWFPRETRARMRAPATFEHPRIAGAWSYRNVTPAGVVATRTVDGMTYDLFVQHETLFPLHQGALTLGPAAVAYSFPLTVSFLSREVRHVVQSDTAVVGVRPFPVAGRPAGFRGAAGIDLAVDVNPAAMDLAVGDARTFVFTVEGRGNVALWPEPELRWPAGLRVYPGNVEVSVGREEIALTGTKTFTYLVVADSTGAYRVAPAPYPYFDVRTGRYVELRTVVVEVSARPGPGRALPTVAAPTALSEPPFRLPVAPTRLSAWMLWVAAVAPPMVVMTLRARRPRRRSAAPKAGRPHDPDSLPELERRFTTALNRLVPEPAACDGPQLVAALRAAGIEGPRAAHIARLRDRLRQAEYGGSAAPDATELVAEVREVLAGPLAERIAGARPGWPAIALVAFTLPAAAGAQDVSAERLLEAGAFAAAADSFAARAAKVPRDPVAWYHLGVAWFSVGSTERARAAWIRAARLAPRHGDIRRALSRTGPGDPRSRRLEWVAPVTPDEALLVALGCWFLGWVLVAGRWKRNLARGLLALGMAAAAYTGLVTARYRTPAALVLVAGTPLREAPYGSAPAVDRLTAGAVVRVEATRPGWILATFGGRRGWLIRSEIVRL